MAPFGVPHIAGQPELVSRSHAPQSGPLGLRGNACLDALRPNETQSVSLCIPTQSVGTRKLFKGPDLFHTAQRFISGTPPASSPTSNAARAKKKEITAPPPKHPTAKLLYDLVTQLEDFELTMDLKLPFKGLDDDKDEVTTTKTKLKIGEHGALIYVGSKMHPAIDRSLVADIPVIEYFPDIPLIGPFFKIQLLELKMDQKTRKLEAYVRYLVFPFWTDVQKTALEAMIKNGMLAPELAKGKGYDLKKGLPLYTWQMLDIALQSMDKKKAADKTAKSKDDKKSKITPLWHQGSVSIKGNFSNKSLSFLGFKLNFASLPPTQKHRLSISGTLTAPSLYVYGMKSLEIESPKVSFRLINDDPNPKPLGIQTAIDPTGSRPPAFALPLYESDQMRIETHFKERDQNLDLKLGKGLRLQGLILKFNKDGVPRISVQKIVAKGLALDGFGIILTTKPDSEAIMENIDLTVKDGKPQFAADVRGQATGIVRYFMENEEKGRMAFELLEEAHGKITVGPDENGKTRTRIEGQLQARLPLLRLSAQSRRFKGFVDLEVTNALLGGHGALTVYTTEAKFSLESLPQKQPLHVKGNSGQVILGHRTSEVPAWKDDIQKTLGRHAKKVLSNMALNLTNIQFAFNRLEIESYYNKERKKPSFLIQKASMGPILLEGNLSQGRIFIRGIPGLYLPVDLVEFRTKRKRPKKKRSMPPQENRPIVKIKVNLLRDQHPAHDERWIQFSDVELFIEDSIDTFSKRDQKRCGTKRQHLRARVKDFSFNHIKREFTVEGVENPHFVLRNPFGAGCLIVE